MISFVASNMSAQAISRMAGFPSLSSDFFALNAPNNADNILSAAGLSGERR